MGRNQNSLVSVLWAVIFVTSASAQSVNASYSANGLTGLAYNGIQFLYTGTFAVNSVQLLLPNNATQGASTSYNSQSFNSSLNQLTQIYPWGTVTVTYTVSANQLNLAITTNNTSSSNTIQQVQYEPMDLIFPTRPQEYDGVDPMLSTNIETPTALTMTAGGVMTVLANPDVTIPLMSGFPWPINSSDTAFPIYVYTGANSSLPNSLPYITRPIAPGASDTYHLSLRFAPAATPLKSVVSDVYSSFAAAYPSKLNWPDRRPIGSLIIATSATNWATNPRGWFLDPTVDVTTAQGVAAFQARLLSWAQNAVSVLQNMNAQGAITWDIEGEQYPQPTTYIGDPTVFATLAPEMAGVIDQYFKTFTNAGLRVGICIRPQQLILGTNGAAPYQQTVADPTQLLINKIQYAYNRWGATLFYVDFNGLPSQPIDAGIFQRVAAAVPGVLIIPEHMNTAYYAVTAPYQELDLGVTSTAQQVRDIYPSAFTVINTASGPIQQDFSLLQAAVQAGDSLMFRGWFDDEPANSQVKSIYGSISTGTPPLVTFVTPSDGAAVSGTLTASVTATSSSGISKVQFAIDGASYGSPITTAPYSAQINTTTLPNALHTISATAYDTVNRQSTASVSINVNNPISTAPPSVSITSPGNNSTVSGQITLSATATDSTGIASVQFAIDGASLGLPVTSSPYATTLNTQNLSNGAHTISATAKDNAGNAAMASVTVVVNNVVNVAPPTVTLNTPANNSTISGSVVVAATATSSIGIASVQFTVDNSAVGSAQTSSPYSVTLNTATLSNGAHTISAIAKDTAGNSTTASLNVTVSNGATDTIPPSVTITYPANNTTVSGIVTLTANVSDNVGVVRAQWWDYGTPIGPMLTSAPWSTTWNTTVINGGAHQITLQAWDAAGNTGYGQIQVNVNAVQQNSPPTVSITSPANGTTVSGTVIVTANTGSGTVNMVQFYLDGSPTGVLLTAAPYNLTLDTTKISNGVHTLSVMASNASGTASTSISLTVNNSTVSPPSVALIYPTPNAILTGSVTLAASANSSIGIGSVRFYVDGSAVGNAVTLAPYNQSLNTTTLTNGAHMISVTATDTAGTSASAGTSVTVSNTTVTPPTVSITTPANNSTVSGNISLTAQASSTVGIAGVTWQIDGSQIGSAIAAVPYSASLITTSVANGSHTITAVAKDNNGNVGNASVTILVNNASADTIPPTITSISPVNNTTVSGQIALAATATDNVGVASVSFAIDGITLGTVTSPPYSLPVDSATLWGGVHYLTVTTRDLAGNTANGQVSFTVSNTAVPTPGESGIGAFAATYYSNANLTGEQFGRLDQAVNFDWNTASPAYPIPAQSFSVQWQGEFAFNAASYRFDLVLTGGARLYLDGALILDQWNQAGVYVDYPVTQALSAGTHTIMMQYQKTGSTALARLNWTQQ